MGGARVRRGGVGVQGMYMSALSGARFSAALRLAGKKPSPKWGLPNPTPWTREGTHRHLARLCTHVNQNLASGVLPQQPPRSLVVPVLHPLRDSQGITVAWPTPVSYAGPIKDRPGAWERAGVAAGAWSAARVEPDARHASA